MDITKMTETELKALALDLIGQREQVNNNLHILQEELKKRAKVAEQPEPKEDVKENK